MKETFRRLQKLVQFIKCMFIYVDMNHQKKESIKKSNLFLIFIFKRKLYAN